MIILHFGMHKTGSSSIQRSLYENLSDERFFYISINNNANQSGPLATMFLENPHNYQAHKRHGRSVSEVASLREDYRKKLKLEIIEASGKKAILSGEGVLRLSYTELLDLKKFLDDLNGDVKACGYVRPPKGFMESAFQQQLKGRGISFFHPPRHYPGYKKKFNFYDMVFGRENVSFWPFEPSCFPRGDVVQDFCKRVGVNFPSESSIHLNESISLPAIRLLYCQRKFGSGHGSGRQAVRDNNLLVKALSVLKGEKLRLHSTLVEPVLRKNSEDMRWMEERMGVSLSEDLAKHDEVAIKSEADLLALEDTETQWLASQLGPEYEVRWHEGMKPHEVAGWLDELRLKLSLQHKAQKELRKAGRSKLSSSGTSSHHLG